jgi:para-aminobenzoate synthetase component 1
MYSHHLDLPYVSTLAPLVDQIELEQFGLIYLDSGQNSANQGNIDILSAEPIQELAIRGDQKVYIDNQPVQRFDGCSLANIIKTLQGEHPERTQTANTTDNLRQTDDNNFHFGWIGYMEYEYGLIQHKLPIPEHLRQRTLAWAGYYDWAIVSNHKQGTTRLHYCDKNKALHFKALADKIRTICSAGTSTAETCTAETSTSDMSANQIATRKALQTAKTFSVDTFKPTINKENYREQFNKIKHWLEAGDCYQVNFTQQYSTAFKGSSWSLFTEIRSHIGTPYSAYMNTPQLKVISLSPEKFITIHNNQVISKPIKGTRKRTNTPLTDEALKQELSNSPKDRAENLMIVDLLRNDIGKCCTSGSVSVPKLFEIESYANVHQMVSTVQGVKSENVSSLELIESAFPGGSITGAPKKRAMEIIAEIEATPRHLYCGSIFYLDQNNNLDSSICIRTLTIEKDTLFCHGGGGIVFDSDCDDEYQESIDKIQNLMDICTQASR